MAPGSASAVTAQPKAPDRFRARRSRRSAAAPAARVPPANPNGPGAPAPALGGGGRRHRHRTRVTPPSPGRRPRSSDGRPGRVGQQVLGGIALGLFARSIVGQRGGQRHRAPVRRFTGRRRLDVQAGQEERPVAPLPRSAAGQRRIGQRLQAHAGDPFQRSFPHDHLLVGQSGWAPGRARIRPGRCAGAGPRASRAPAVAAARSAQAAPACRASHRCCAARQRGGPAVRRSLATAGCRPPAPPAGRPGSAVGSNNVSSRASSKNASSA